VNAKDWNGCTALINSVDFGHEDIAKVLIAAGADVNASDNNGRTALMRACMRGAWHSVKVLIAGHANVNARDGNGLTALSYVIDDTGEFVKALKAAGAKR
jgi:ankyrin repeat protein